MKCLLALSMFFVMYCSVDYCPFSKMKNMLNFAEDVVWEWYDKTTPSGQQIYVPDHHIKVKCVSHSHGAK
jgi:hypothetical protein